MKKDGLVRFGKFLVSSGISCLVDMGLFTLLNWLLPVLGFGGTDEALIMISTVCARVVSSICNYLLNRKAVFKSDDKKSVVRYYILAVCQMLVSGALVSGLSWLVKFIFPAWGAVNAVKTVIKGIVDFLLFFVSYKIQKEWVFRSNE